MKIYDFCTYMYNQFPEPFSTPFARDLLTNIVVDVLTQYGDDLAPDVLYRIIPQINRDELTSFFTE